MKTDLILWTAIDDFNRLIAGKRIQGFVKNEINRIILRLDHSGRTDRTGIVRFNLLSPTKLEGTEYAVFKYQGIRSGYPSVEDMIRLGNQPWEKFYLMLLGDLVELKYRHLTL